MRTPGSDERVVVVPLPSFSLTSLPSFSLTSLPSSSSSQPSPLVLRPSSSHPSVVMQLSFNMWVVVNVVGDDVAASLWVMSGMEWQQTHQNAVNFHPRFAFGCEGGGGSGRRVKRSKRIHLQLAFGRKGGGGGGRRVETDERTTSSSRLDVREVVVVVGASKPTKEPPPACVWT